MNAIRPFDIHFDVRTDAGSNRRGEPRDPDRFSPTLREWHRVLWSKPLPSGAILTLDDQTGGEYLHHRSDLGEFFLGSDAIVHTFDSLAAMRHITDQIPDAERDRFLSSSYTIGGMTLFPSNRIDGRPTINGARDMHPGIRDRFDLTLECIRRHYAGTAPNPFHDVLNRYGRFFDLFVDFRGYVDFFLMNDLVSDDYGTVRFFGPFGDFPAQPLPRTMDDYREYRRRSVDFVEARGIRMLEAVSARL